MEKVSEELRNKVEQTIEGGLSEKALSAFRNKLEDAISSVHDDLIWSIKDNAAAELAGAAMEMAEKSVRALLSGNENEARRYLGCLEGHWTGRSDSPEYGRKREDYEWWPVIHGKLHEGSQADLRRRIVDAHKDLIANQRILDLEDQVMSLVAQVNKLDREKQALFDIVNDCA